MNPNAQLPRQPRDKLRGAVALLAPDDVGAAIALLEQLIPTTTKAEADEVWGAVRRAYDQEKAGAGTAESATQLTRVHIAGLVRAHEIPADLRPLVSDLMRGRRVRRRGRKRKATNPQRMAGMPRRRARGSIEESDVPPVERLLRLVGELPDGRLEDALLLIDDMLPDAVDYVPLDEEVRNAWADVRRAIALERRRSEKHSAQQGSAKERLPIAASLYPEDSMLLQSDCLAVLIEAGPVPPDLRTLVADVLERKRIRRPGRKPPDLDEVLEQAYLADRVARVKRVIVRHISRGGHCRDAHMEASELVSRQFKVSTDQLDAWFHPRQRDKLSEHRESLRADLQIRDRPHRHFRRLVARQVAAKRRGSTAGEIEM